MRTSVRSDAGSPSLGCSCQNVVDRRRLRPGRIAEHIAVDGRRFGRASRGRDVC